MKKLLRNLPLVLAFFAILIVCRSIFDITFSSDDDVAFSTLSFRSGGFFQASFDHACAAGRFYQLFAVSLTQLAFLSSFFWTNLCRWMGTTLVFGVFYWALRTFRISLATSSFVLMLAVVGMFSGNRYNPFHAYPLWFVLGMASFLIAAALFNLYLQNRVRWLLWGSLAAYVVSTLTYEPFLGLGIYFPLRFWSAKENRQKIGPLLPFAGALAAWLALFFGFRQICDSAYVGSKMSLGSFAESWQVIKTFSMGAVNWPALFNMHGRKLGSLDWMWTYVLGHLTFFVSWWGLKSAELDLKKSLYLWSVGLLFIFAPNLLYPLTEHYRTAVKLNWVGPHYIGSYYSTFGWALFFAGLSFFALSFFANPKGRKILGAALSAVFSYAAMGNHLGNMEHAETRRAVSARFEMIDKILADRPLENDSVVLAPALWENPLYVEVDDYLHWTNYFTEKSGHSVLVIRNKDRLCKDGNCRREPTRGMTIAYSRPNRKGFVAEGKIQEIIWKNDGTPQHIFVNTVRGYTAEPQKILPLKYRNKSGQKKIQSVSVEDSGFFDLEDAGHDPVDLKSLELN